MKTTPTSKGIVIGLAITACVVAVGLFYLTKELSRGYRPTAATPADTSGQSAAPAASSDTSSDEITVIEADLMVLKQELLDIAEGAE